MELPITDRVVDAQRDALYRYDDEAHRKNVNEAPWTRDPRYFKTVRISAVALAKMVMHARSGGRYEVMGLMQGYIDGAAFVVTNAVPLPVEGTETRVNAQDEANEYSVEYFSLCRQEGRLENVCGWYHSHPGYGCWLSGIDVETQFIQQQFQDPYLAVVIDPDRTISAGKIEIGAFRTFPKDFNKAPEFSLSSGEGVAAGAAAAAGTASGAATSTSTSANTTTTPTSGGDSGGGGGGGGEAGGGGPANVPLAKASDFGAHSDRYYPLEVEHFKSTLDASLVDRLWTKYWVQTLASNPLRTNREFSGRQVFDLGSKVREASSAFSRAVASAASRGGGGGLATTAGLGMSMSMAGVDASAVMSGRERMSLDGGSGGGGANLASHRHLEGAMERIMRDARQVAAKEKAGLMATQVKVGIFTAVDEEGAQKKRGSEKDVVQEMSEAT